MPELRVESVGSFLHTDIKGEKLPSSPEGFPFSDALLASLVEHTPIVTAIVDDDERIDDKIVGFPADGLVGLMRRSSLHGRSFELCVGEHNAATTDLALWEDEHGNEFNSLMLKGNNFSRPGIMESLTAPSGYIPHGLQEGDVLLRVIRASKYMRSHGVSSEAIVAVLEPKQLRYSNPKASDPEASAEYLSQAQYKQRLIVDYANEQDKTPETLERVARAISPMHFFITLRAMSTNVRLSELVFGNDEVIRRSLEDTFGKMNRQLAKHGVEKRFDVGDQKSIRDYYLHILPHVIGQNLGKLHRSGLRHTFPVFGNVNALGGLIDTDSVYGEPLELGDEAVTTEDFKRDVQYYSLGTGDLNGYDLGAMMLQADRPDDNDETALFHLHNCAAAFELSFREGYLRRRFAYTGEESYAASLEIVEAAHETFGWSSGTVYVIKSIFGKVFDGRAISELVESDVTDKVIDSYFMTWSDSQAMQAYTAKIMPKLTHAYLRNGISTAVAKDEAAQAQLNEMYDFLDSELRANYFETSRFEAKIRAWIEVHASESDDQTYATVKRLAEYFIIDFCLETSANRPQEPEEKRQATINDIDLSLESVVEPTEPVDGIYVLVSGKLARINTGIAAQEVATYLRPRSAFDSVNFDIKTQRKASQDFEIKGTKTDHIKEIFVAGEVKKVNIHETTNVPTGEGTVTLSAADAADYVIWTTVNPNTEAVTIHARLKAKDKKEFTETLRAKGHALNFGERLVDLATANLTSTIALLEQRITEP